MAKGGKSSGPVVWVLMALLILGLGGFGVTNFGGTIRSIASVGDRDVGVNDYGRALSDELQARSQQAQRAVNMAELEQRGIDDQVRAQLFLIAAMDNEADRIGLSVGDAEVRRQLVGNQNLQGLDGQFDQNAYRFFLEQQGFNEVDFETRLREAAARSILQGAVISAVATPEIYGERLTAWASETRDFTHAELIAADLPEPLPEPTDDQIQAHYEAQIPAFTRPEIRALTYVWLAPETLAAEIELDEATLQDAYNARIDRYVTPERRMVERLIYPTAEDATAAKARVDAGEATFADLAADRGLTLEDADLGEVTEEDLGAAAAPVFALEQPGVVGPFDTDLGPALFSMNAILLPQETTLDEVRDDLSSELTLDRARRMTLEMGEDIQDILAGGATLEQVAEETPMVLGTIDFDATTQDGIAAYSAFREAAQTISTDDFANLAELEDGGLFALRLDEIRAPAPIPLEEVREDVIASWEQTETQTRLMALAEEFLEQLNDGATLESLGLVVTRYDGIDRGAFIEGVPAAAIEQVFAIDDGAHAMITIAGVHLVRTDATIAADPEDPEVAQLRGALDRQAAQGLAGDIFAAYAAALEAEVGISINQTAIDSVHAQMR